MDDVDRVVARDYEPSDQDVVKARLRTVGVQEYHLTIPGGKYSTFDGTLPNRLAGSTHNDWILYDVGGSRASVGHIFISNSPHLTGVTPPGDSETHGLPTSTTSILSSF